MDTVSSAVLPRRSVERRDDPRSSRVGPEAAAGFRDRVGSVAAEIITGVRKRVPEFNRPLSGPLGAVLTAAIQAVLIQGADAVLDPDREREDWTGMFRCFGALAFEHGCPVSALDSAYNVAEAILSDQVAVYARLHGVPVAARRDLTEAITHHIQRLSTVSVEGHTSAEIGSPDALLRRRQELLRLMLTEPAPDPGIVAEAAREARWPMTGSAVAVALRQPTTQGRPRARRFDPLALSDLDCDRPGLVVATNRIDPAELLTAFPGWRAAIGPTVPAVEAATSLRLARRTLDLAERNLIPGGAVVSCAEHALELTLFADDTLLDELVRRRLAPLASRTARQRQWMLVTLHEWLAAMGRIGEVAERLSLHPQTVRYRMHQLEALFHEQLADPRARFELQLATRVELLRDSADKARARQRTDRTIGLDWSIPQARGHRGNTS